jgi:hypothetical protein
MFERWDLEFDEPIAQRVIPGTDCVITIQLGPARRDKNDENSGWYCPYRITGIPGESDHKMFGAGEDAISAIIGALCNLGAELNSTWKERLGLNWLDQEHLGLLDAHKLPGYKPPTPEEKQTGQAVYDVYSNPAATEQDRRAALDKWAKQFETERPGD